MSNEALNTVLSHLVIPVVVIHDAALPQPSPTGWSSVAFRSPR